MALSDVGLNYVSKNANQFIRNAEDATNAVTRLNYALGRSSGNDFFGRGLSLATRNLNLLNSGVEENNDAFSQNIKILGTVSSVTTKASGSFSQLQGQIKPLPPYIMKATGALEAFGKVFIKDPMLRENYLNFIFNLAKTFAKIPPPVLAAAAALTAFKVGSFILEKFGERAAGLSNIAASFEKLRTSAGLSTEWLNDFAASADNQLTQAELLTLSNKALAGSFGDFQTELAGSLPLLLEFARVRAAATGEDSGFLFQSLIEGIKKQEPEILDNLGLVVRLDEVYDKYAQTLGTTRDNLTAVQKQQAILTRVQSEATRNINILGEATLSNADRMEARKNIYSDIADKISLSIQPLLAFFLDVEIFFARLIGETLSPLIGIITSIISTVSAGLTRFFDQFKPIFEFVAELIQAALAPFDALFRVLARLLPIVYELWSWFSPLGIAIKVVGASLRFLTPLLEGVTFLFQTLADLIIGAIDFLSFLGNTIGNVISNALSPLLNWLTNLGFTFENIKVVITQLASVMAVGFGKATAAMVNVMAGAAKNILTIVADLAQGIADFLIGQSPPPKGPLSKIDTGGAKVFEAWLDGFTSLSLKPIEQITGEVNQALGDIGKLSLPQVETRIARLDKALRPFEEQLSIVQSRFEAIQKPAEAALSAIDRQLDMAVEALTKGDESALNSVKALDAQRASIYKNLELQQQQVDFAQIQLALKQAQQSEERALLEIQKKRLSGQQLTTKEIEKEKAILAKNDAAGKTATGGSGGASVGAAKDSPAVSNPTGSEFGNLMLEGFGSEIDLSIFDEIGTQQERLSMESGRIGEGLAGLPDRFGDAFMGVFGPDGTISTWINDIFGSEGLFATKMTEITGEDGIIVTAWRGIFGTEGSIATMINSLFGVGGTFETQFTYASGFVTDLGTNIGSIVDNIEAALTGEQSLQTTIENLFGEDGPVKAMLNQFNQMFIDVYNSVFGPDGIFSGVGQQLQALIAAPILALLEGLENLINAFISLAEQFLNGIIDNVEGLIEHIPPELRGGLGDLIGYDLQMPRISFTPPPLNIQSSRGGTSGRPSSTGIGGAATGGIFTGGMLQVGEKGREYIAPASKIGVFPNNFVTAIESLESVLMGYMSIPSASNAGGNSYVNNSSTSQTVNINQPMNPTSLRQQLNLMG